MNTLSYLHNLKNKNKIKMLRDKYTRSNLMYYNLQ